MEEKSNFDLYLERKRRNPAVRRRLAIASVIWDIALQGACGYALCSGTQPADPNIILDLMAQEAQAMGLYE